MISSCVAPSPTFMCGAVRSSARPADAQVALILIGEKMPPVRPATTMFRNECCVSTLETPLRHCAMVDTGLGGTRPQSQPAAQSCLTNAVPAGRPVWIVAWEQAGRAIASETTVSFDKPDMDIC